MPRKKCEPLRGKCYWHVDIGSVGWCFQDDRFANSESSHPFSGLHCLKNGDHLKVFAKDGSAVLFDGVIDFASNEGHGVSQKGIPLKMWAELFRKEYPAEFIPAKTIVSKKKK